MQKFNSLKRVTIMGLPWQISSYINLVNSSVWLFFAMCLLSSCDKANEVNIDATNNENSHLKARSSKPNIILVLVDDVGYEIPHYTGGQSYSTPNLDRMAKEGMQFTQCFASPLCSPSRCMLLTGKYNFRNYTSWGKLDTSQRTIANMLKNAGYATCVSGKWQLDGGEASIHAFGFDKYMVWDPFYHSGSGSNDDVADGHYKNPKIYFDGNLLPDAAVKGKYGEDFFRNYAFDFIDQNLNNPFFIYWAINLCHNPFSPTPDDPEFDSWTNRDEIRRDTVFFPSMVKYMDKEIGMLVDKLNNAGIAQNTVILFIGDNGTKKYIHSLFQGEVIEGAKGQPILYGTHVPMIAYSPGSIAAGSKNNNLVDFTDFLPSIADIAGIATPKNYGTLDGVSFAPGLIGANRTEREWVYCYYYPHPEKDTLRGQWVNNEKFKLYGDGRVYNFAKDPLELNPIPDNELTPEQRSIKNKALKRLKNIE